MLNCVQVLNQVCSAFKAPKNRSITVVSDAKKNNLFIYYRCVRFCLMLSLAFLKKVWSCCCCMLECRCL